MKKVKVSLLVPAYNERENVPHLFSYFDEFRKEKGLDDWEMVFVDDGSSDGTYELAESLSKKYQNIKIARHRKNLGKTQALLTGASIAEGEIFIIYDADMQFTLEDALKLVEKLENEGLDIVAGWKVGKYEKKAVSKIYNWLSKILFKIPVRDMNAMKALRKEVLLEIPMRKDWHRYIIPLAQEEGFKIGEAPVELRKRLYGKSKYSSPLRILIGFFDLVAVKFQLSFKRKPMLFFGTLGLISFILGVITGLIAIYLRYVKHYGFRPILYLVILLILAGLLLFIAGFLGEMVAGMEDRLEKLEKKLRE